MMTEEGERGKRNNPTFLKAPNTSTMLRMGEGGEGSCKFPENEGGGFKWKIFGELPRGTVFW